MKHLTIILIILLVVFTSQGQTKEGSKLYNENGKLLADTSFSISKADLKLWSEIEDTITNVFMQWLVYPEMLHESGITGKIIISFTIDSNGFINNYKLEKALKYTSVYPLFFESCVYSLFRASNHSNHTYNSFDYKTNKLYLPIEFKLIKNDPFKKIENNWIKYNEKITPLIERDRTR